MSDTVNQFEDTLTTAEKMERARDQARAAIPNYSLGPVTDYNIGGVPYKTATLTFGEPKRQVTIRELDEADQWELSEFGGAHTADDNWMYRATVAMSVTAIDDVPTLASSRSSATRKADLARVLRQLGALGVPAVALAGAELLVNIYGGKSGLPFADAVAGNS